MSTEDVTAEIAAVLAEHAAFGWDGYGYHRCFCGYPLTSTQWADARPKWTIHLAHHLADLLAARDRRVRAEALREAADEADSIGHHWSGAPALAFFALAGDLRARIEAGA